MASGSESSDEGFGGEVESDLEDERMEVDLRKQDLGDSGYGANATSLITMETRYIECAGLVCFTFQNPKHVEVVQH